MTLLSAILAGSVTAATQLAEGCAGPLLQAPVRYAVAADEVVLLADLNGDDVPEIITSGNHVDESASFSVLPNLGDGRFGSEQSVSSRFGERLEEVADLDSDGLPDLLVSGYWQNGISTYGGLGSLQFDAGTAYETATHGGPSRAADYDGDGITDIVSLSFGSGNPVRVHLFRGRPDGTFEPKRTYETALAVAASPSTRIHGGELELLANEHSGRLALLRVSAEGISTSMLDAGPGFDLSSLFADVNGDGIEDIVDTNDGGSEGANNPFEWIFVRLGRADGNFGDRIQLPHVRRMDFPTELRAGDLDADGNIDLVVSDFHGSTLYYFRGHGTGTFAAASAIDAGGPVNGLAIADLNGDERPDLVTVNNKRSVSVILNSGSRCSQPRRRSVRH